MNTTGINKMENPAPIVLFVYNRPDHTRQTLEALGANLLAAESELFIFSDAPKNKEASELVQAVRSLIKTVKGFKSVTIIERDTNFGLAKSIIGGVTDIINQYGKVIVLEDDVITSVYFLKFMNGALDYYASKNNVWHIAGWNYWDKKNRRCGAFFCNYMECGGGWATWKNRWQYFEKDPDKLIKDFSEEDIYKFNLYGSANMWNVVLSNRSGKMNTWAVFWGAIIFQHNGLCLCPTFSFTKNIGFDNTGVHSGSSNDYSNYLLCEEEVDFNTIKTVVNKKEFKKIMHFYRKPKRLYRRILDFTKKIIRKL
jgi:hypothetical protein